MKYNLLLILILTFKIASAQTGNWQWATSFGGKSIDRGISKSADLSGSIYSAGEFRDTADFDPGPGTTSLITAATTSDIFITKQDSNGNLLWVKQIGGGGYDGATGLEVDPVNGDLYVCGYFQQTVDFDPGPGQALRTSGGNQDIFLLKLDSAGNFRWVYHAGALSDDRANSLTLEKMTNGYVYVSGKFENLVDFDPGPADASLMTVTGSDIFIVKTDTAGNFIWVKSISGNGPYSAGILHCTSDPATGGFYATGYFSGTADLNPDSATILSYLATERDAFVIRLDAAGQLMWAAQLSGVDNEQGNWITLGNGYQVLTTGYFEGITDFDPGATGNFLNTSGGTDIYLSILDTSGNYIAAKKIGGPALDFGTAIVTDQNNNCYVTGAFQSGIDADPGTGSLSLTSAGGIDMCMVKLDVNFDFAGAVKIGGTASDYNTSMTNDAYGNFIVSGTFASSQMIFGTDTITKPAGNNPDIFTAKSGPFVITAIQTVSQENKVTVYPNPANEILNINTTAPSKYIQIRTADGKLIFKEEIKGFNHIINTQQLKDGFYLLEIIGNGSVSATRFAVIHL